MKNRTCENCFFWKRLRPYGGEILGRCQDEEIDSYTFAAAKEPCFTPDGSHNIDNWVDAVLVITDQYERMGNMLSMMY